MSAERWIVVRLHNKASWLNFEKKCRFVSMIRKKQHIDKNKISGDFANTFKVVL